MLDNERSFMEEVNEFGSVAIAPGLNVEELELMIDRMKKVRNFVKPLPVIMFLNQDDYDRLCAEMDQIERYSLDQDWGEAPRVSVRMRDLIILFNIFETDQDYTLLVPVTHEYPDPQRSLLIKKKYDDEV